MLRIVLTGDTLSLAGVLSREEAGRALTDIRGRLAAAAPGRMHLDLSGLERIDSAGVAMIDQLRQELQARGLEAELTRVPAQVSEALKLFSAPAAPAPTPQVRESLFYRVGDAAVKAAHTAWIMLYLIADTLYFAVVGLFNRRGIRKGEFINQSILIGVNALPIVALISFLIGFILALQSAAQLRQFGAAIYVADLIAIAMTREMGPLITAILFAGRSGSAIAAELATMGVTEETDALRSMGLNPTRYVLVPKFYAITLTMPLLTVLSIIIGIGGAMVIGYSYLGIGPKPFYQEVMTVLFFRDILTGLIKSVVFAWIIALVGAYYGFSARGGSEDVGRVTTAAVVASIFWVILADSLLGLVFYFGQGLEY
ncbi:MAG TPA: MlaE family lipid ABC transporter permease subunit [bacterium]|nr:MlaE family lipid ABC transporter permease subunit [bacterium]HPM60358.1 MlaE family lipid ABC transporter permease subunit [bacterium]